MSDITYNQMSSTFHDLTADSYPTDNAKKFEGGFNALCDAVYSSFFPESSYSDLTEDFVGKFDKPFTVTARPWVTSELVDFLSKSPHISLESLEYFLDEIYAIFGNVNIETVIHTDPEEGWTKVVFVIHSGIDDLDELMKYEDSFFEKADSDSKLLSVLPYVIVSQA